MDDMGDWYNFTTTQKSPIGSIWEGRDRLRDSIEQRCKVKISLLHHPNEIHLRKEQMKDRKIWVKLNDIYIFNEDFGMHGWDEIRVSIELENENDNQIDMFITPSPNKSYSTLNEEFKKRVVSLIRHSGDGKWFQLAKGQKVPKVPKKIREQTWINTFGEVFKHSCYIPWCTNTINCFDFQTGHNEPRSKGGSISPDNLKPICSRCNSSMSNNYSINEWSKEGDKKITLEEMAEGLI